MTEAAPWSDHAIEPGADATLAVCNRTWVETVQRVMAERDRECQAKEALHAALGASERALASWRDGYGEMQAARDAYAAALEAIRAVCARSTNRYALTAWDIADAALARGRAEGEVDDG